MPVSIDASGLSEAFEDLARDEAQEAAGRAFTASQEVLQEVGDGREWDLFSIMQSGFPPEWDPALEGFVFGYTHLASRYMNDGTAPHEIEGDPWLYFENEEGDLIRVHEADHPGTPAVRYLEQGMAEAERWLEGRA